MYYSSKYRSPVGELLIVCTDNGLCGLWMNGQKYFCPLKVEIAPDDNNPILVSTKQWLDKYFEGKNPDIGCLKLDPQGSKFRKDVWEILKGIPYGELTTYGEIANKLAKKYNRKTMSAQAVGGAVGHNPISIIIPCHRVVGANRSLTGYAGGVERKIQLLKFEGVDVESLSVPLKGTAL